MKSRPGLLRSYLRIHNQPFSSCVAGRFDAVQDEDGPHDRGGAAWAAVELGQDFPGLEGGIGAFVEGPDLTWLR